jgi:hypothetical protein
LAFIDSYSVRRSSPNTLFKAFITDSHLLVFTGRSHTYLEKISIATNIKLYPQLYFENFVISIKSTSHWSYMTNTTTLFLLTGLFIALCRLYGSCRCSNLFILYLLRTNFYLGRQNWLDLTNRNIFSLNIVPKKPSELCGDFKYNEIYVE